MALMSNVPAVIVDKAVELFFSVVIRHGQDIRQKLFLERFLRDCGLEEGGSDESNRLDEIFRKLSSNPTGQQLLFEIYRKVCLSRSRELGPKAMGIFAARLTNEDRMANECEELVFDALEQLNDLELIGIKNFYRAINWKGNRRFGHLPHTFVTKSMSGKEQRIKGELLVNTFDDEISIDLHESSVERKDEYQETVSQPQLEEFLGRWATRLRSMGIVTEKCVEQQQTTFEDHDRQDITLNRSFSVIVPECFLEIIVPLIERSSGPAD